jgi:hypothetical protein
MAATSAGASPSARYPTDQPGTGALDGAMTVAVVPTYNEAGNIRELIDRVGAALPGVHVLVVDDDSPDGTADLVRAHPQFDNVVHLLARTGDRGLGNAYRAGFEWAARNGYAVVLQLDADLSHPPESLPDLVDALATADIVIGSRYVTGGRTVGWPWHRRMISRWAGWYARVVLRLPTHDPTAGFKAYRVDALSQIDVGTTTTSGYGFQVECVWRAVRTGLKIAEVPIVFTDRVVGSSKMTLGVAVEAASRIASWRLAAMVSALRRPSRLAALLACVLTFAIHLLYLDGTLMSDEGGFAMVARWSGQGRDLYGAQWVDRPPGLIGLFWVANLLGTHGVRLVAAIVATAFVAAAAWSGWAARGTRAAVWAAWAGFFLVTNPLTQTYALNGELIAATWVMVVVGASLHALRPDTSARRSRALATIAGAAAAAAILTKQNFVDGLAFLLVLGLGQAVAGRPSGGRPPALAAGAALGFAIPIGVVATWAMQNGGIDRVVYAMYGFRMDAATTMAHWSHAAPDQRLRDLLGLTFGSGIATLAVAILLAGRRRLLRPSPLLLAIGAAVVAEVVGVVLGGNYWAHYLIGLSPMLALGAGLAATVQDRSARFVQALVVAPAVVAVGLSPAAANAVDSPNQVTVTAGWLRQTSAAGDSLVVLYSHANLIDASGLRPAYPYAWSLPIRTLDPNSTLLTEVMTDPASAPTWVVEWDHLHTWGLDRHHTIEAALTDGYTQVASVCGHPIWLRNGATRDIDFLDACDSP